MPKFLASCHHNEEEISWHLERNVRCWPVQINGNKFATGQILRKQVDVVKGWILAGWAQKFPEPWGKVCMWNLKGSIWEYVSGKL
jgi:hypothetical protein